MMSVLLIWRTVALQINMVIIIGINHHRVNTRTGRDPKDKKNARNDEENGGEHVPLLNQSPTNSINNNNNTGGYGAYHNQYQQRAAVEEYNRTQNSYNTYRKAPAQPARQTVAVAPAQLAPVAPPLQKPSSASESSSMYPAI